MLRAVNITKFIGGQLILDNVTVDLPNRAITVVIGPNGSGKSTLLRALALTDPPSSGTIRVGEEEISFPRENGTIGRYWPRVSMVFQQLFLWPHMTLKRNIMLPLDDARKTSFSPGLSPKELVDLLGITNVMDKYPNEVSVGQRQAAALVRAIALEPAYLLLDEVTSAMDVENIRRIIEVLFRLRELGAGLCVVTHFMGFAKDIADRVIFLENGTVRETGQANALRHPQTGRLQQFIQLAE